uniref:Galectin n=1 Tax=Laticauda laticaudata TaxID=8630 RepID=A0A8C5RGR8_LATLA
QLAMFPIWCVGGRGGIQPVWTDSGIPIVEIWISSENQFHVNLKNILLGNIALHINPRFKEGVLVRNSFINGAWGSEERNIAFLPFCPGVGQKTHIRVTFNTDGPHVNGMHPVSALTDKRTRSRGLQLPCPPLDLGPQMWQLFRLVNFNSQDSPASLKSLNRQVGRPLL